MTDPGELARRYLRQRHDLGEPPFVLPEAVERPSPVTSPHPQPPGETEDAAAPARPPAPDGPKWRQGAPEMPGPGLTVALPSADLFVNDPLADADLEEIATQVRSCTKCPLCEGRTNAVPGEGPADAKLVVVGEGPGANEDEQGRPFVGRAGDLLTKMLAAIDFPRDRVFICNVVKCRPPGNRNPERAEIDACVKYLYRQIVLVQPDVILAMGSTAACTMLNARGSLGSLRNKVHTFQGIPLIVTYHPAALLRNPNWKKPAWDDVRIARRILAGDR